MEDSTSSVGALHITKPEAAATTLAPQGWRRFEVTGMTCISCVRRVEQALLSVPDVSSAVVDPLKRQAEVVFDQSPVTLATLEAAVVGAGYGLQEPEPAGKQRSNIATFAPPALGWLLAAGLAGAALLAGVYVAVVGLVQGLDHALGLMTGDWYCVVPIVLGFGVQVGLYAYARGSLRHQYGTKGTKALAGAGTGTSTVAMVACCAHHLADVLPIVGLTGVAIFLNDYRGPFLALGIISNGAGIALMLRMIRKENQSVQSAKAQTLAR